MSYDPDIDVSPSDRASRTILVTGATGNQGGAVMRHLLSNGWRVRAMTRSVKRAKDMGLNIRDVEWVQADYMDPATLDRALRGVYGAFCVTTPAEDGPRAETAQGVNMANAADRAGVKHFVYSSIASSDEGTGIPEFDSKYAVETFLRGLSIPITVVRPVLFMDGLCTSDMHREILEGHLRYGLPPDKKVQMISLDDFGRSVAKVFRQPSKYVGITLDLAGDELTMPQVAEVLGTVMDCRVTYRPISAADIKMMDPRRGTMMEWMGARGHHVDLERVRAFNPGLTDFHHWAQRVTWNAEECYPLPPEMDDPSVR